MCDTKKKMYIISFIQLIYTYNIVIQLNMLFIKHTIPIKYRVCTIRVLHLSNGTQACHIVPNLERFCSFILRDVISKHFFR